MESREKSTPNACDVNGEPVVIHEVLSVGRCQKPTVASRLGSDSTGLTPLGISSPRSSAGDTPDDTRYWHADNARATLLLMEAGVSLCTGAQAGVLVENGEREAVERHPSVDVEELASFVPTAYRNAFLKHACRLFPRGTVAEGIYRAWRGRLDPAWWLDLFGERAQVDPALETFVREGLLRAIEEDARRLAGKSAEVCGKLTFEHRYRDSKGVECRRWWRATCGSHRCPHCSKLLAFAEAARVRSQLIRDVEAHRPPALFLTLTLDPTRYSAPVEALRQLHVTFRDFIELLRARCGLAAAGGELAYWYAVESHASGWPHVHALIRCEALANKMLSCERRVKRSRTPDELATAESWQRREEAATRSKTARNENRRLLAEYVGTRGCKGVPAHVRRALHARAELEAERLVSAEPVAPTVMDLVADPAPSWDALCERVRAARQKKRATGRGACPFPDLRHQLSDIAVAVGFGKAGFYLEPVLDIDKAAYYLTKTQLRSSPSTVAEELTKTRQVPGVIPRHFRRFRSSGKAGNGRLTSFFLDEKREPSLKVDTIDLAIIRAEVEEVRDHYTERGVALAGDLLEVDFRGDVPPHGGVRKRVLGSFVAEGRPVTTSARPAPPLAACPGPAPPE
jgi:hypothetical protein